MCKMNKERVTIKDEDTYCQWCDVDVDACALALRDFLRRENLQLPNLVINRMNRFKFYKKIYMINIDY